MAEHYLLIKLMEKKNIYAQWKQGCVAWEEYKNAIWTCRDEIKEAKVQMGLNFSRNVENNMQNKLVWGTSVASARADHG